ncbi:hypothetical protein [Flavobacterium sp. Root186]|uniref:hypothetical protein n=1 Tax=Flavobacterium sp. Root186 TaxID=1736485 RepID=UPI0006F6B2A2|nr:hypothetical protein [Flavobacterium sp. Root186]KRB58126.1 hypothetical protein ASD98_07660 [Flavobacterium sp. Root186]
MEKKLRIYTPNNSFKVDKRLLSLLILWSITFLIYSTKSKFPSNEENLELLGFVFVIIAFLYSLYFMISNSFICETTNGEYSGNLIIDSEKITCNLDVYTIYEIEKVSILSDYFHGKFNGNTIAWERKKSNGVKNYIEIYKKDGEYKKYFFLQTKTENIRMFSDELRTYYRFGKLGEQNYKNIVD